MGCGYYLHPHEEGVHVPIIANLTEMIDIEPLYVAQEKREEAFAYREEIK
jgi:hypothetical protein